MKTIYNAVLERLRERLPNLYIDMEKGQLKNVTANKRPAVRLPCALIRIDIPKCSDVTDTIQDCRAGITVRVVFDPNERSRTDSNVDDNVREQHLEPYDVIADVYSALQGFDTDNLNPISRISQGEDDHDRLFIYRQVFACHFEDLTADET